MPSRSSTSLAGWLTGSVSRVDSAILTVAAKQEAGPTGGVKDQPERPDSQQLARAPTLSSMYSNAETPSEARQIVPALTKGALAAAAGDPLAVGQRVAVCRGTGRWNVLLKRPSLEGICGIVVVQASHPSTRTTVQLSNGGREVLRLLRHNLQRLEDPRTT